MGARQAGPTGTLLPLLLAGALLAGCQTDGDPRGGGFIDGVTNLSTGGYDKYVGERQGELKASQDEAKVLEARAQSIEAERKALDRELKEASDELSVLQQRLSVLQSDLEAKRRLAEAEREKLDEATKKAAAARKKINTMKAQQPGSVESQRESIQDLKKLIGGVASLVKELSG